MADAYTDVTIQGNIEYYSPENTSMEQKQSLLPLLLLLLRLLTRQTDRCNPYATAAVAIVVVVVVVVADCCVVQDGSRVQALRCASGEPGLCVFKSVAPKS